MDDECECPTCCCRHRPECDNPWHYTPIGVVRAMNEFGTLLPCHWNKTADRPSGVFCRWYVTPFGSDSNGYCEEHAVMVLRDLED